MDLDARTILDAFQFIAISGVAIYAHVMSRGRATEAKVESNAVDLRKALTDHETRISGLQADVKQMPSQVDIRELYSRLGQLHGDIQQVNGRLEGIGRAVDLVNQHLLSQTP